MLARAIEAGRRISDLAQLSDTALAAIVKKDEAAASRSATLDSSRPRTDTVMEYFEPCVEAIEALDPERLARLLDEAEENLAEPFMLEDLVTPLLQHVQNECRHGTLRIGQKHVADSVIRGHLMGYIVRPGTGTGLRIVVAGGAANADDFPLLKLAVATRAYGWQPLCLGFGLSADEIAHAAEHGKALCTSIAAHPVEDVLLPNELRKLRQALPESHPIFLHGANLAPFKTVIAEAQVIPVQTFGELRLALNRVHQLPPTHEK